MQTTSITSKGQIVIPSAVRRRFGITEGTRFTVETDEAAGDNSGSSWSMPIGS